MIKEFDVFLFDFDGTLFDTYESSIYVFEEAYRRIGVSINKEDILGYTREPIPVSYKRLMGSMDGYESFIASIDELVFSDKVTEMSEIYSDSQAVIEYLKSQNKKIGIVTSNSKEHVLDVLSKYGLEHSFDVIVGNREAPNPKPSPEPLLKALELLDFNALDKVAYIGDSLNDMIAAERAKIKPILLDRLFEFADYKQYQIINSLDEIKR